MAEINGRPFLDFLMDYLRSYNFRRFILCIGYLGNFVRTYYQKGIHDGTILISEEKRPLGTAGAIKNAASIIKSPTFMVANADSFCNADLTRFVDFHFRKKALLSMVVTKGNDSRDCGSVSLDRSCKITHFIEKSKRNTGYLNAGMYLLQREILSLIPPHEKFSLEHDLFPLLIRQKSYGYVTSHVLLDIGTPEGYSTAKWILS